MRQINKILFFTLTNIGDVVMTLPALDLLRHLFPGASITVVSGERAADLFRDNPFISRFYPYDKHARFSEKMLFLRRLRGEHFDLVIDLRDSLLGLLLGRYKLALFRPSLPKNTHRWERHLARARFLAGKGEGAGAKGGCIFISDADREYCRNLLLRSGFVPGEAPLVISPDARSSTKCWPKEKFAELAEELVKEKGNLLLVGDRDNRATTAYISAKVPGAVDLAGKTNLNQLACLLKHASLLIANDSAALHLASYLDTPIVAIFGPTDEIRSGPWSVHRKVVKQDIPCRPCMRAQCVDSARRCLSLITVGEVKEVVQQLLKETAEKT